MDTGEDGVLPRALPAQIGVMIPNSMETQDAKGLRHRTTSCKRDMRER